METDAEMGIFVLHGRKKYGKSYGNACLYETLSFIFSLKWLKLVK